MISIKAILISEKYKPWTRLGGGDSLLRIRCLGSLRNAPLGGGSVDDDYAKTTAAKGTRG